MVLRQLDYFDMVFRHEDKECYILKTMFPNICKKIIESLYGFKDNNITSDDYLKKLWYTNEFSIRQSLDELLFSYSLDKDTFDVNLFVILANTFGYLESEDVITIIRENILSLNEIVIENDLLQKIKKIKSQLLITVNSNKLTKYSLVGYYTETVTYNTYYKMTNIYFGKSNLFACVRYKNIEIYTDSKITSNLETIHILYFQLFL